MKSLFLHFSISVLLLGSGATASADPPGSRGESRGRGERLQLDRMDAERNARGEEVRSNREEESKPARMSPEQRRALRQQINEAGQDIYQPPKR